MTNANVIQPKGSTAFVIRQKELTASERDVLRQDRERWERVGKGGHLDDWLAFFPGLAIRRRLAMQMATTNRPEGRAYTSTYAALLRADGFDTIDKTAMAALTAVLWLGDDPERMAILRNLREALSPGQRSRINSPISARQRVTAILRDRQAGREDQQDPIAILKDTLAKKERAIARLEAALARAQTQLQSIKGRWRTRR